MIVKTKTHGWTLSNVGWDHVLPASLLSPLICQTVENFMKKYEFQNCLLKKMFPMHLSIAWQQSLKIQQWCQHFSPLLAILDITGHTYRVTCNVTCECKHCTLLLINSCPDLHSLLYACRTSAKWTGKNLPQLKMFLIWKFRRRTGKLSFCTIRANFLAARWDSSMLPKRTKRGSL